MSTLTRPITGRLSDWEPHLIPRQEPEAHQEPDIDRLDDIAFLLRRLTYEEMMEFASGLWQPMITTQPATQEELAKLIHGWSVGR